MAKSLRSRVGKRNKQKLRARVFEPVEHARKERLSKKLFDLTAQKSGQHEFHEAESDKPDTQRVDLFEGDSLIEGSSGEAQTLNKDPEQAEDRTKQDSEAMQIDPLNNNPLRPASGHRGSGKLRKNGRAKGKDAILFPVHRHSSKAMNGRRSANRR